MSVLNKLSALVERLYSETEGYIDNPSDAQLWYNRGYANGVAAYLIAQGVADKIHNVELDTAGVHNSDRIMEWHKAYHHGYEMGERESAEVHQASQT